MIRSFGENQIPECAEDFAKLLPSIWAPAHDQLAPDAFNLAAQLSECSSGNFSAVLPNESGGSAAIWQTVIDHGVQFSQTNANGRKNTHLKELSYDFGMAIVEPGNKADDSQYLAKVQTIENRVVESDIKPPERWIQVRCARLFMDHPDMHSLQQASDLQSAFSNPKDLAVTSYSLHTTWDEQAKDLDSFNEWIPNDTTIWDETLGAADKELQAKYGLRGVAYADLMRGLSTGTLISQQSHIQTAPSERPPRRLFKFRR